jgi:GNAT superfamily N-acetyltransferase
MVLGTEITFSFVPPADLTPVCLDQIHAMVLAGGSVNATHVRSNLENAYLIGYAMENKIIIGCSCLKHPRDALIQRLKTATGMDFSGCVERGYTSVRPEYRSLGVGRRLLEGLTARAGDYKVFAVIDEANLATQKIARWNHTRKIATYVSETTNKHMGIWMPAHMRPPEQQNDSGPEPFHREDIG